MVILAALVLALISLIVLAVASRCAASPVGQRALEAWAAHYQGMAGEYLAKKKPDERKI